MTIEFLLTSLLIVAAPGTGALVTLAAGLTRGTRAALVAAAGCTLGIVPHMTLAVTGLATLLRTSATAFGALKYLGVAYLAWMAWGIVRDRGPLSLDGDGRVRTDRQVIAHSVAVNLLNPKLSIFFLAFLPQFVRADEARPVRLMLQLSLVFMLLTLVVFAGYGMCAARLRRHVLSRPALLKGMRWVFAGAFVSLGVKLALVRQ